jgi:hypothetical protein
VPAPEQLRHELRRLPVTTLVQRCRRFRRSGSRTPDELAIVLALRSLARRIEAATAEADELEREILEHVRALVPELLDEPGVGPIVAAQLIVTWSHRDRVRSEAAFARPCRRRTTSRLERPNDPAPAQPRRRPSTQPRAAHRRPSPPPARPGNEELHHSPDRRRQDFTRGDPHPQALPRPPPLPRDAKRNTAQDLTVIEDSFLNARAASR